MPFVNLAKSCSKNLPGVKSEVFINLVSNIATITETATAGITGLTLQGTGGLVTRTKFIRVNADLDSVQFTSDAQFKTAGGYEQALTFRVSKPRIALVNFINEIRDSLSCGLTAIYVDNNNQAWLYGANGATKEGLDRPINAAEIKYDTGVLMTDEDTQAYTVTLKRLGGFLPSPLAANLVTSIVANTATYINFTA
jgi:hypothetical protein